MRRSHGATYDRCRVTLVFNIIEGEVEGTDISGLKVAAIADTPKVMTNGNWRLGVFIDDKASNEQTEKLLGVFSGQLGGPMEALGPLIGENLGVERAPIEVREEETPSDDSTDEPKPKPDQDNNGGGTEFDPEQYESPPQEAPDTGTPP